MNNKLIPFIAAAILFIGIFTVFVTVVYAKGSNFFCSKKQNIVITLKNDADINKAKEAILKIPQIKIIKIKYRDEEWSNYVNKYDLPKMENPFKNEFIIKSKRNADANEIFNKIKSLNFVEDVKYDVPPECAEK